LKAKASDEEKRAVAASEIYLELLQQLGKN